ncbi:hypothetical protein BpHYR1_046336 [Brachionus plicatilis]|uniref:Uncharacterized protein n=1 Tax=Brachionus plicatilis TaxID=10195 RepID=A0A3M7PHC8_BRAPC|nr:hypothetical protein BpHYR1_046336 [Brachionus plicatilis]
MEYIRQKSRLCLVNYSLFHLLNLNSMALKFVCSLFFFQNVISAEINFRVTQKQSIILRRFLKLHKLSVY